MTTILDTPEQIEMFRLLQLKHALMLEVNTGMLHSKGSVMKVANETMLRRRFIEYPSRTKRAVLKQLDKYIEFRQEELFGG